MVNVKEKSFRFRVFFSFILTFSFLFSTLSGIILFLRPEGSLASWTGWKVLGLDKKQWEGFHSVFVLVFIIISIIHLIYNWKAFKSYFRIISKHRNESPRFLKFAGEFTAALLFMVIIFLGFVQKWTPVKSIANLRNSLKNGKIAVTIMPPAAEAGKLTLSELCQLMGVKEKKLLDAAFIGGIQLENLENTLRETARKNGMTPEQVYSVLRTRLAQPCP